MIKSTEIKRHPLNLDFFFLGNPQSPIGHNAKMTACIVTDIKPILSWFHTDIDIILLFSLSAYGHIAHFTSHPISLKLANFPLFFYFLLITCKLSAVQRWAPVPRPPVASWPSGQVGPGVNAHPRAIFLNCLHVCSPAGWILFYFFAAHCAVNRWK